MKPVTKTFIHDHVARGPSGDPVARVILLDDSAYREGAEIPVALFLVPASRTKNVLSFVFYIDGAAYCVPQDTPKGKIHLAGGVYRVNHVTLQPVRS